MWTFVSCRTYSLVTSLGAKVEQQGVEIPFHRAFRRDYVRLKAFSGDPWRSAAETGSFVPNRVISHFDTNTPL